MIEYLKRVYYFAKQIAKAVAHRGIAFNGGDGAAADAPDVLAETPLLP